MAALLGAYDAQIKLGLPSIGGKDSMSGTFNDIDVPPTLCSFAVDVAEISDVVTNELKKAGSRLVKFTIQKDEYDLPDFAFIMSQYEKITKLMDSGEVPENILPGVKALGEFYLNFLMKEKEID